MYAFYSIRLVTPSDVRRQRDYPLPIVQVSQEGRRHRSLETRQVLVLSISTQY